MCKDNHFDEKQKKPDKIKSGTIHVEESDLQEMCARF